MLVARHAIVGHPRRMNQSGQPEGPAEGADEAGHWMGLDSLDREQLARSMHKEDANTVISVTSATNKVLAKGGRLNLDCEEGRGHGDHHAPCAGNH